MRLLLVQSFYLASRVVLASADNGVVVFAGIESIQLTSAL